MKHQILTVLAVMFLAISTAAQSRPDFSGTWTIDPARSETPARGRGGRGRGRGAAGDGPTMVIITQTEVELKIETRRGQQSLSAVYKLDGSPSSNQGGLGNTVVSKARWDGAKLVIESTRDVQGFSLSTTEVRSLDASVKEMTVETTTATPRGGNQSFKQVFTKGS